MSIFKLPISLVQDTVMKKVAAKIGIFLQWVKFCSLLLITVIQQLTIQSRVEKTVIHSVTVC